MPFVQLIGEQPLYALIEEVKRENPKPRFLPVLGDFHTAYNFLATIYRKSKDQD